MGTIIEIVLVIFFIAVILVFVLVRRAKRQVPNDPEIPYDVPTYTAMDDNVNDD